MSRMGVVTKIRLCSISISDTIIIIGLSARNQIVLHEDKKYYPEANEVYGEDVEVLVQEEDTQALTESMVAPTKMKPSLIQEREMPPTTYKKE
jgi:116 kDa U5 small nuclear ribonucleoprotein component